MHERIFWSDGYLYTLTGLVAVRKSTFVKTHGTLPLRYEFLLHINYTSIKLTEKLNLYSDIEKNININ